MIDAARVEPKLRRATRPTKASKERRLAGKVRDQRVKRLRGRVRGEHRGRGRSVDRVDRQVGELVPDARLDRWRAAAVQPTDRRAGTAAE